MKLAIFDMDGTLFNTNDVNYYAYKEALSKYNISLDYEYYCAHCNGRHYKVFIPELVGNNKEIIEEIHNNKKNLYKGFLNKTIVNKHLFEIIKSIKSEYKIALVTTASKKNALEMLEYTNTLEYFDLILTAENVKNVKPNPEGFLLAMQHFNATSHETVIFEDSDVGIQAARKTNASVIRIDKF